MYSVTSRSLAQRATHRYQRQIPWFGNQISNLVQNEQIFPCSCSSSCLRQLLYAFCCTCKLVRKAKMHRLRNMQQQAKLICTRCTRAIQEGCLLAPLLPFSSLSLSLFFFSLSPLSSSSSLRFAFKNRFGERAPGTQPHGWYGGHLG